MKDKKWESEMTAEESKQVGLPPGTVVYIGKKRAEDVKVSIIEYDKDEFRERKVTEIDECFPIKRKPTITWINVSGIHRVDVIERIGEYLGLHPLVLEDIANSRQRPKADDYDKYLYAVLKTASFDDQTNEVTFDQISLVLGSSYVISFQEGEGRTLFDTVKNRIRRAKGHIRSMGADFLAYALIDEIIDNYYVILEKLGKRLDDVEEEVVSDPTPKTLQAIHDLKRKMMFVRKSVWPTREVISHLERGGTSFIHKTTSVYLRDLYDHVIQVIDAIDTSRDTLSVMLDIYLSTVSNRMNEVMKVLTIIATIFIPLTLIASIYGMNFRFMPELEHPLGYPMVYLAMLSIAAVMVMYFRKRKWL